MKTGESSSDYSGLFARLKRAQSQQQADTDIRDETGDPPSPSQSQVPIPPHQVAPHRPTLPTTSNVLNLWHPFGSDAIVDGIRLPGGLFYVGSDLKASNGFGPDPALIDPSLPIDRANQGRVGNNVGYIGYWPSYFTITPTARAAYLNWLSSGRRDPRAPISWVFLFFYGLERRVLVDPALDPTAVMDFVSIRNEVMRLHGIYGKDSSFDRYSTNFLLLLDLLAPTAQRHGSLIGAVKSLGIPWYLLVRLGEVIRQGDPISPELALAWARADADTALRTPANRCRTEFDELFTIRYTNKYGAGIKVTDVDQPLLFNYKPASSGIPVKNINTGIPDASHSARMHHVLLNLVTECTLSLDAYSRLLGRKPTAYGTPAAKKLLPPELIKEKVKPPSKAKANTGPDASSSRYASPHKNAKEFFAGRPTPPNREGKVPSRTIPPKPELDFDFDLRPTPVIPRTIKPTIVPKKTVIPVVPPPPEPVAPPEPTRIELDPTVIASTLADTHAVSKILHSILAEETVPQVSQIPEAESDIAEGENSPDPNANIKLELHLDAAHFQLLRILETQPVWARSEFDAECKILGLLPNGALDWLNESAMDYSGDPLTDSGQDPIMIDQQVIKDMLS